MELCEGKKVWVKLMKTAATANLYVICMYRGRCGRYGLAIMKSMKIPCFAWDVDVFHGHTPQSIENSHSAFHVQEHESLGVTARKGLL